METPALIAVAAGVSLGIVFGYRMTKIMLPKVGGPFAKRPLVIGLAVIGCIFVLVPGVVVSLQVGRQLGGAAPSADMLFWVGLSIAAVIGTSLAAGAFAGILSARLIEQLLENMRR